MLVYIKELVVVLALSGLVFVLGRPAALNFMSESDFKRRRNIWLILTVAAFSSPSFWLFALIAMATLYWGGKKDANPLALYLLLMSVIPPVSLEIPAIAVNRFFELDIFRMLSFCVLIPAAWRLRKDRSADRIHGLEKVDLLLLGFGLLQVVLYVPPDLPNHLILHSSATNALRTAFLFVIDVYVLYYVASRTCTSHRAIGEALAAFVLACSVMASIAVFESVRHWLLYTDLYARWGGERLDAQYFMRAGLLRAEASSGHPLALGFLLAVAFGGWLYIKSHLKGWGLKVAVTGLLWLGLLVSLSRGPWLGALAIYFTYAFIGPGGASRIWKAGLVFLLVAGIVFASPLGDRVIQELPFLGGNVAAGSLTYREALAQRSWQLIKASPVLGDQLALSKMQNLRQGQGIIDLVNTYLEVALFHGLLGLALFIAPPLLAMSRAYSASRKLAAPDPSMALLGACIATCLVGALILFADTSFRGPTEHLFYALIGLAVAYAHLVRSPGKQPFPSVVRQTGAVLAADSRP